MRALAAAMARRGRALCLAPLCAPLKPNSPTASAGQRGTCATMCRNPSSLADGAALAQRRLVCLLAPRRAKPRRRHFVFVRSISICRSCPGPFRRRSSGVRVEIDEFRRGQIDFAPPPPGPPVFSSAGPWRLATGDWRAHRRLADWTATAAASRWARSAGRLVCARPPLLFARALVIAAAFARKPAPHSKAAGRQIAD